MAARHAEERALDTEPTPSTLGARRQSVAIVVASAVGLLILYAAVVGMGDSRAYSGSDAGGKAATARVMADRGTAEPDVGYWAEAIDPDGDHHPLVNTERRGSQWVQGTSVPFSLATGWLWGVGGPTAALLLPMAGGLLAAASARRLARNLGAASGVAEAAFWLVGAFGPAAFYAADLWEHAPATGLVMFVVATLVRPRNRWDALAAGISAGAAVVLRAESALVLFALGVAAVGVAPIRRAWLSRWRWMLLGAIGAAGPIVANGLLERRYLETGLRGERASTLASGAGSALVGRLQDAVVETASPFADDGALAIVSGLLLAAGALGLALIALGVWRARPPVVRLVAVTVGALYLGRLLQGPGFLPGMLAVSPLAAAGVVAGVRRRGVDPSIRVVSVGSMAALPCIWLLQWQGNHAAQWGGRYLLSVGALLTVVGVVVVLRPSVPRSYQVAMVTLSVLIAVVGLVWHVQRTTTVGRMFDQIEALPDDTVVVATDPNLLREGGAWYGDTPWLTVTDLDILFDEGGLASRLGIDHVAVVIDVGDDEARARMAGPGAFEVVDEEMLETPGGPQQLVVLHRDG